MRKQQDNGAKLRARIESIKGMYQGGYIGLDEAKDLVKPLLDQMNASGRVIAKEYGKTFKPLTFSYIFR